MGTEALEKRGVLNLDYPIEHGVIKHWENMEKIWHHVFYSELKVVPEDHPCLLTEVPLNAKKDKETTTETFFETFNSPALYLSNSAVLALYCTGRTTGVVVDSGADVTNTVPIFEGYALPHAIRTMDFAGRALTSYLLKEMTSKGVTFPKSNEFEIVREIKEREGYLGEPEAEKAYTLPDGKEVRLGQEVGQCADALFNPSLIGNFWILIHLSI